MARRSRRSSRSRRSRGSGRQPMIFGYPWYYFAGAGLLLYAVTRPGSTQAAARKAAPGVTMVQSGVPAVELPAAPYMLTSGD